MEKLNFANQQLQGKQWGQRLKHAGMVCALGIHLPHAVPFVAAQESLVQKEINRRLDNSSKANQLLHSGDVAYNSRDYKTAVANYAQAFTLLPGGSTTHELREAAAERYASAATERSRQLAKGGDYDAAKKLLDDVLKPGIAPAHLGAIKLRGQIDDPIRYNHALTPEHVSNAQKVGMTLREAEGFYNLGQYDRAVIVYQDVLRIDPFNKAARRGMEKIEAAKSDYFRAAYDHTRAELLSAVDKGWELSIPPPVDQVLLSRANQEESSGPSLREKLAGIIVETIDLDNTSLEEALDFVRIQSRLGDAPSSTGEQQGINIVLNVDLTQSKSAQAIHSSRIDLKANNLPLAKILDYITDQSHTQWRSDGAAILVSPLGSSDETILSRTFHVPPTFLSSASTQKSDDSENIFDSDSDNSEGLLSTRISITEFLKNNGISFPEGASASYSASSNTLIIRNTSSNIDLVEQLISIISSEDPVQVIIRTTIMRISEEKLKSLSFDWMITPAHLGGALFLGGGTVGNGTALADMPLNPFSGLGSPITAGTRSGDTGLHSDSIDTFIKAGSLGFGNSDIRAPGILTLTGVYSGIQVQMMMRGMNRKTGADILQKPSTIARSGERTKIEIIEEFMYPTEYEPPELPTTVGASGSAVAPVSPATPTAFVTRNVGITLEVEPTVGPNKKFIELSIAPELVEFEGFVNYGTPILTNSTEIFGRFNTSTVTQNGILMPVFKITQLRNQTITIQDGATIVLGGLMSSNKTKIEDKVPILGDIPYAGRLFRSESEQTINVALIITVQVELVDPAGFPWKGR